MHLLGSKENVSKLSSDCFGINFRGLLGVVSKTNQEDNEDVED